MTAIVKLWLLVRGRWAPLMAVFLFVPAGLAIAYLALDPTSASTSRAGIAAAWIVAAIASYWALDELLREESESGAAQLYILAGQEARHYWESVFAGVVLTYVVFLLSMAVSALLFDMTIAAWRPLVLAGGIYALGTAAILVFARSLAGGAGIGALLGPLLAFPLQFPILLAGIECSKAALTGEPAPEKWMLLGLFFGILYLLLGQATATFLNKE